MDIYLRDYLGPGGRYPYAALAPKMEQLHAEGTQVHLISVPGHLIGMNHQGSKFPWSDCAGRVYRTAADLLSMKRGRKGW